MTYNDTLNELLFNFFLDLRKKEIDKRQRAELIAKYLEQTGKSQRALAKELGIPHSTIQDWLLINRIKPETYDKFIEEGENDTSIYRMLRNNKKAPEKKFKTLLITEELRKAQVKYKYYINNSSRLDAEAIREMKELVNILNRAIIHAERK